MSFPGWSHCGSRVFPSTQMCLQVSACEVSAVSAPHGAKDYLAVLDIPLATAPPLNVFLASQMVSNLVSDLHLTIPFLVPALSVRVLWSVDAVTKLEV